MHTEKNKTEWKLGLLSILLDKTTTLGINEIKSKKALLKLHNNLLGVFTNCLPTHTQKLRDEKNELF